MRTRQRSPWALVGIGCALLLGAGVVVFFAFLFVGQRMAREVREQMTDRPLRQSAVRQMLNAARLPDGYEPALGLSVPLLGRVVILEAEPAQAGSADRSRAQFLYLVHRESDRSPGQGDALDRLLELRGLVIERDAPVAAGRLVAGDQTLVFRTIRARLKTRSGALWPALVALIDVRCPETRGRARFAAWIEPDPASGLPAEESDLGGTPADPEAIASFLSHFRLCPEK